MITTSSVCLFVWFFCVCVCCFLCRFSSACVSSISCLLGFDLLWCWWYFYFLSTYLFCASPVCLSGSSLCRFSVCCSGHLQLGKLSYSPTLPFHSHGFHVPAGWSVACIHVHGLLFAAFPISEYVSSWLMDILSLCNFLFFISFFLCKLCYVCSCLLISMDVIISSSLHFPSPSLSLSLLFLQVSSACHTTQGQIPWVCLLLWFYSLFLCFSPSHLHLSFFF